MMSSQHETPDHARELIERLMRVVEEIGLPLDLAKATQIIAHLLGPVASQPNPARPKRSRSTAAEALRKQQIAILKVTLNVPEYVAADIREIIAPPGYDPEQENSLAGRPSARRLNLPLTAEDELWLGRALALTEEFHRTVLPIFKIDPRTEDVVGRAHDVEARHAFDDDGDDDTALTAHERLDVAERKARAGELVAELEAMVARLGKAPFIYPPKDFVLSLRRTMLMVDGREFWTPLGSEPWLEISYEIPGSFRYTDVNWHASRGLRLLLGLRREFLEAGWTDNGPEWQVTLRDGKNPAETFTTTAPDTGKALAAVVAAYASLRLVNQHARLGTMVLLRAQGPDGPLDPRQVIAAAAEEPLVKRGKLFLNGKLVAKRQRGRAVF